jgi:ribosome-associated translation inhibitor RaiA
MFVNVHTDNHIKTSDDLTRRVEDEVIGTLERFGDQVVTVEVHLNDVNGHKHGVDKRCMMEARLSGLQPIAVTHMAETLDEAIEGAAEKLERSIDSTVDKLSHHKGRTSFGGDQTI